MCTSKIMCLQDKKMIKKIKIIKLSDVHFQDNVRTEALPPLLREGSYTSYSDTHQPTTQRSIKKKTKTITKTTAKTQTNTKTTAKTDTSLPRWEREATPLTVTPTNQQLKYISRKRQRQRQRQKQSRRQMQRQRPLPLEGGKPPPSSVTPPNQQLNPHLQHISNPGTTERSRAGFKYMHV